MCGEQPAGVASRLLAVIRRSAGVSAAAFLNQSLNRTRSFADGHAEGICGAAPFDFGDTFGESFATDGDSEWDTDQVGILEFEAWSLVAIIHQHINAGVGESSIDLIGDLHNLGVGDIKRDELDGVGCGLNGPDYAIFVVAGFDDGSDNAGDTDTVAAHDDGM